MRYVIISERPSGASTMKFGEGADDIDEIKQLLRRAPVGTEVWRIPPGQTHIGRSDDPDDRMGVVEECDGSCDRPVRCTRHWFLDTDIARRES